MNCQDFKYLVLSDRTSKPKVDKTHDIKYVLYYTNNFNYLYV